MSMYRMAMKQAKMAKQKQTASKKKRGGGARKSVDYNKLSPSTAYSRSNSRLASQGMPQKTGILIADPVRR